MSQNKQKEKEKRVEIRNAEDTERPMPTSTRSMLTLKPLPKIDPKDKGKKMIDEEARKVQEEWKAKEEKKRLAKEEATKVALTNEYDFIHARINTDKILAEELQKEERENLPLNKEQNFFMIPLLHKGNFLLNKGVKRPWKRRGLNEEGFNKTQEKKTQQWHLPEQEVTSARYKERKSGPNEDDVGKGHRPQPVDDSDDEHKQCIRLLHKVSSPDRNYLVIYRVNGHFRAFNYLMENNQQEWEIVRWRLYEACRVCILELKDGTVIYMLVERRYPLSKELLQQMLDLGLEGWKRIGNCLHYNWKDLSKQKYIIMRSNVENGLMKGLGVGKPPHNKWSSVLHALTWH
ncbi:hypothetical protein Tco_0039792 [Tanacetum coccineum]